MEAAGVDAHAFHELSTGGVDGVVDKSVRASTRDLETCSFKVLRHKKFAHRGAADVARADEHDLHGFIPPIDTTLLNHYAPYLVHYFLP